MRIGSRLFEATYAHTSDYDEALRFLIAYIELHRDKDPAFTTWLSNALAGPAGQTALLWCARWAGCGFPQIVLSHTLAASLMATRILAEATDDVRPPWPAFLITMPEGLLSVPDLHNPQEGKGEMSVDYVAVFHEPTFVNIKARSRTSELLLAMHKKSIAAGLEDQEDELLRPPKPGAYALEEVHARTLSLLWKLMIGVDLELSDPSRFKAPSGGARALRPPRPGVAPAAATFRLTRKVIVDCREAVTEHLRGIRRSAPSVQSLVRGHWKRQPFGPGQAERKWIHLEPYWRGPEEAPVVVRTVSIKEKPEAAPTAGGVEGAARGGRKGGGVD